MTFAITQASQSFVHFISLRDKHFPWYWCPDDLSNTKQ